MNPPAFWHKGGLLGWLLMPVGAAVGVVTRLRNARPGWQAGVPVICCGNAGLGGAGKTTLALDIAQRLQARGVEVHMLTRGYGGKARGVLRVDPATHDAALVGDEPLLLAEVAPTWVSADRVAGARAAIAAGAKALVMDDGLQNPGLAKTLSFLAIDGAVGFGNGRVAPAGPLREKPRRAAARCAAAVLIGQDRAGAVAAIPGTKVLRARLAPSGRLDGKLVFAFTGIARPGKFHATLVQAGAELADEASFPDHHRFTAAELADVLSRATALGATPVTTPKDAARLPPDVRSKVTVVGVTLAWENEAELEALLASAVP